MPMIDVYAPTGTFPDPHTLATDLAATLMRIEGVPDIPMFRTNTAAFVHELPSDIPMFRTNTAAFVHELPSASLSDVDGGSRHVRVQVLTNAGALDRDKQLAVVEQLTDLVASAAGDDGLKQSTWVLLTEAVPGGWGLLGRAHTNDELIAAARAEIARLGGS